VVFQGFSRSKYGKILLVWQNKESESSYFVEKFYLKHFFEAKVFQDERINCSVAGAHR
jgi:hypothetical protein